jgi:hydrogenase maturation protein HypF
MRTRKQRPTKPFAVMYPDIVRLRDDLEAGAVAIQQLESPAAPIVLLRVKGQTTPPLDLAGIAPGLHQIGAMLPNAPLFEVLLSNFGRPIVATSCNISHAPLLYEDEQAWPELSQLADCLLTHNRGIVMPQDDSVVSLRQQSDGISQPVVLRRARGLAPAFIQQGLSVPEQTILALGAELKSTFTLTHLGNVNISQYLGDLSDFDTQERYHLALRHLKGLFKAQPTAVIGDLHPGYYTTQLGQDLARQWQAPWIQVQHHEAHFAAVLAENDLFSSETPVLGVIWDGTGLGTDGQIWGGEFFLYTSKPPSAQTGLFNRCAQMAYFPVLLGDKMAREPRLSALSACRDLPDADAFLKQKFTDVEWDLYKKVVGRNDQIQTSSAGRLFDAVAALLGLADQVSYEGEAGLLLEDLARSYCDRHGFDFEGAYSVGIDAAAAPVVLRTEDLLKQIIRDLQSGEDKAYIAAKFHGALVDSIGRMAGQLHVKNIAFSGGVFQNALLLDMIPSRLGPDYHLYFHRQLSPNDENISFGQWAYAVHHGTIPLH